MEDESVRLHAFQTLLDGSKLATEPKVEMTTLRKLCARGIPAHPPHLRPLAWSLLLEVLPSDKQQWKQAKRTHRERYYALVRTLMDDLAKLDAPSEVPAASDTLLTQLSKDLDRSFSSSPFFKARTAPSRNSPLAPPRDAVKGATESASDSETDDDTQIESSSAILNRRAAFRRLEMIAEAEHRKAHTPAVDRKGKGRDLGPALDLEIQSTQKTLRPSLSLEPVLSPRITLSMTESGAITPLYSAPLTTPQLSLSIPSAESSPSSSNNKTPSPITLLSPRPIPVSKLPQRPDSPALPGSFLQPDTHAESILRILYVFVKAHPQWEYTQGFADVLIPLYMVYALGGDGEPVLRTRSNSRKTKRLPKEDGLPALTSQDVPWGRHAEEETFWAFAALMGELGGVVAGPPKGLSWESGTEIDGAKAALEKLGRRVRWADEELWTALRKRNLDPATPFYSYRFVALLLSRDVPQDAVLRSWDYMLSQPDTTPKQNPKLDLLLDICTAMLLLVKAELLGPVRKPVHRKATSASGLWGTPENVEMQDETVDSLDPNDPDALGEAFARGMKLLQSYPLASHGGIEAVLDVAFRLQQERLLVGGTKDDPDSQAWIDAKSALDNRSSWASAALMRKAASLAGSKLWATSAATSNQAAANHDAPTANVAKPSQSWGSYAMSKWNSSTKAPPASEGHSRSSWGSLSIAAGRLLGPAQVDESMPDPADPYTPMPTSPPTPRRARYADGQEQLSSAHSRLSGSPTYLESLSSIPGRPRSDSASSGRSALSLQERLAGLTTSVAPATLPTTPQAVASPASARPLLLSASARRASGPTATPPALGRVGHARMSLSGQGSPSARSALSPPLTSTPNTDSETRTIPIGRRRHVTPANRGSVDETPSAGTGGITAAAIRLRNATSVSGSVSPSLPRSPRQAGLAKSVAKPRLVGRRPLDKSRPMSSSSIDSSTSPSTPGGSSSPNEDDGVRSTQVKKYPLTDSAMPPATLEDDASTDELDEVLIANGVHASVLRSVWRGSACAVKVVHADMEYSMKPHNITREIRILQRASHPNIVNLLHTSRLMSPPARRLYLPLYTVSLADILSHPGFVPFPTPACLAPIVDKRIFQTVSHSFSYQLLTGISYLHGLDPPIAHRDVKPDNVMLDADGTIKLIDFATAWDAASSVSDNDADVCQVGSGPYRPPELLFGPHHYDALALDMWSAGATLAELFTPYRLCDEHSIRAIDVALLPAGDDAFTSTLDYDSDDSAGSSDHPARFAGNKSWRRQSLFNGDVGDLGLAWSIFCVCGTPSTERWPSYYNLPDAGKVQYAETSNVPLQRLLPFLDDTYMAELLSATLRLEPRSRLTAPEALRQIAVHPFLLPQSVHATSHHAGVDVDSGGLLRDFISTIV